MTINDFDEINLRKLNSLATLDGDDDDNIRQRQSRCAQRFLCVRQDQEGIFIIMATTVSLRSTIYGLGKPRLLWDKRYHVLQTEDTDDE
jgi:hypothetical protein